MYDLSFTTGGLFLAESRITIGLRLRSLEWKAVRSTILAENLFQLPTLATAKRVSAEVCKRLQNLSARECDLLSTGNSREATAMAWLAACRTYPLIAVFARDLLRVRFHEGNTKLASTMVADFIEEQARWHPELEATTAGTRRKLRQVMMRMARESGMLAKDGTIQGLLPSIRLESALQSAGLEARLLFTIPETYSS
jgi:hypothetical protein